LQNKAISYKELENLVSQLLAEVGQLRGELNYCNARINDLESELARYKSPKNSGNSSVPPSKDENRPKGNQSLREKSGLKSGGQPGHEGSTLQMSPLPDQIIEHVPCFCTLCGEDLSMVVPILMGKRQVVDIPPIKPLYIQHETYSRQCSCGNLCEGVFPLNVNAPVQYGPRVEATVSYLSARQYVPYNRIAELFNDMFNMPVSEGSVGNLLQRFKGKAYPAYLLIKAEIEKATSVGADETGAVINGGKAWIWAWQDLWNTFMAVSDNRGSKTVNDTFPNGLPKAILGSDAWACHLSTLSAGHQLCLAHMLRELNYFIQIYPQNDWPKQVKALFQSSLNFKKTLGKEDYPGYLPDRQSIEEQLNALLENQPTETDKGLLPFFKRLVKHRKSIFTFLYHHDVPPDNNASERSIRNVKVKQKVSGQFKSISGAESFAIIRSVIDTLIKRNLNIFDALYQLANLAPE
jgi:transposase